MKCLITQSDHRKWAKIPWNQKDNKTTLITTSNYSVAWIRAVISEIWRAAGWRYHKNPADACRRKIAVCADTKRQTVTCVALGQFSVLYLNVDRITIFELRIIWLPLIFYTQNSPSSFPDRYLKYWINIWWSGNFDII